VAWILGLSDGDEVTASFWRYDITPGSTPPSCRIWGHWNDDPEDVYGYSGSAGGNNDYGPGTGGDMVEHTWTVEEGHTGLVGEVRTYSDPATGFHRRPDITAPTGRHHWTPETYLNLQVGGHLGGIRPLLVARPQNSYSSPTEG
jgi:hypothetical protein